MAVRVDVLGEVTRVLRNRRGEHVGQHASHVRGSQRVVHALESLAEQKPIHVTEEVVHILHRPLNVDLAEVVGVDTVPVELRYVYGVASGCHVVLPIDCQPSGNVGGRPEAVHNAGMAKWRRQGPKGFVKSFVEAQKSAHAGGAQTFGGNPPATNTWKCPECGATVLARKDKCPQCGGQKPDGENA